MALTLSEDAKNEFLDEIDQNYITKVWATIVLCTPKMLAYAIDPKPKRMQWMNTYAYIGLTETHFNIVTLSSLNVTVPTGRFSIPFQDIEQLDILKKALKYVVTFKLQCELVRINFSLTAIGINVKDQLRNVQMLIEKLEEK